MSKLSRRQFIGTSAGGMLAVGAAAGWTSGPNPQPAARAGAAPFNRPVSFQAYAVRREIGEDFPGTLKTVQALGYAGVEMCSPNGGHYKEVGFGNLTALPPAEIKRIIEDTGLFCKSAHFESNEVLGGDPARTADYAAAMGLTDVVMSGSGFGDDASADDIKRWGERANAAGAVVKSAGLRLGYHNHQVGPMVGRTPQYELIMEATDPDLVVMQFQLASISGGFDPVYYLDKYAGRFASLHMADYDPALKSTRRPGRLGGVVPVGDGMIDWPALLRAAMKSDMADHGWIVEIETADAVDDMRRSINFLKNNVQV